MIRQEFYDFVNFGMPESEQDLNHEDNEKFLILFENIFSLRPVSNDEAMLLAENLGKDDLDGIGSLIAGIIASSPMWPSDKFLYINKFSDPLTYLKRSAIFSGKVSYEFTSINNKALSINIDNADDILLKINENISVVDLQIILSLFWLKEKEEIDSLVVAHLVPIIKNCIIFNKIGKDCFASNSLSLELLELVFEIKFQ